MSAFEIPEPNVGQIWFDKDDRVTSRYVRILAVLDDGRVLVARGRDGSGTESKIRIDRLRRRFVFDPNQRTRP